MKVVSLVAADADVSRTRAKGQDQRQNCKLQCLLPKSGYAIIMSRSGCSSRKAGSRRSSLSLSP